MQWILPNRSTYRPIVSSVWRQPTQPGRHDWQISYQSGQCRPERLKTASGSPADLASLICSGRHRPSNPISTEASLWAGGSARQYNGEWESRRHYPSDLIQQNCSSPTDKTRVRLNWRVHPRTVLSSRNDGIGIYTQIPHWSYYASRRCINCYRSLGFARRCPSVSSFEVVCITV